MPGKYEALLNGTRSNGPGQPGGAVPLIGETPSAIDVFEPGDSYDPQAPAPVPKPKGSKYYDMLSGGAELRASDPSFIEQATSNFSPVNDPSKMAGVGSQAVASLPTNIKERAGYFAKQRFPDDPQAVNRYGVQDGRLFYQGDDGQFYYEEPSLSTSPSEIAKYGASLAGPALPFAGGIIGGAATTPAGGIPGAGMGAAAGDEMRQVLAMSLAGQEDFKPMQSAKEAALGVVGQGLGVGAGKAINHFKGVPKDAHLLKNPVRQAQMTELQKSAQEWGVQLTPAEVSGLRSLKTEQNILGDLPASSDMMQSFYQRRNTEQVPVAVDKMLGKLSPVDSAEIGAQKLQGGAQGAIEFAKGERRAVAAPLYKEVFPKRIPPSHFSSIANSNRLIAKAINGAERDDVTRFYIDKYKKETGAEISSNSVGFLDAVKQSLDGKAARAKVAGDNKAYAAYSESAAQLRTAIDKAVPGYEKARAGYAGESGAVDALTDGEVGLAAKKNPTQLASVPRTLFETGPKAVASNRAAFVKAGKEQEWNDGLRAYLTESFDKASKEYISGNANPGARFRATVFGTGKQKAAMQSAMSPDQWAGFNRLMDVLEASGSVPQGGSRTAFAAQGIENMERQSGNAAVEAALNPIGIPGRLQKAYKSIMMDRNADKLAQIITSPDSLAKLKKLKGFDPKDIRAMGVAAQVMEDAGIGLAPREGKVAPGAL